MALPKLTHLLLESWILSSCFKFLLKIFPILDTREIFHTVKTQLSLFPPLSQAAMKFAKLSRFISSLKFKLGLNIYFFLKKNLNLFSIYCMVSAQGYIKMYKNSEESSTNFLCNREEGICVSMSQPQNKKNKTCHREKYI